MPLHGAAGCAGSGRQQSPTRGELSGLGKGFSRPRPRHHRPERWAQRWHEPSHDQWAGQWPPSRWRDPSVVRTLRRHGWERAARPRRRQRGNRDPPGERRARERTRRRASIPIETHPRQMARRSRTVPTSRRTPRSRRTVCSTPGPMIRPSRTNQL